MRRHRSFSILGTLGALACSSVSGTEEQRVQGTIGLARSDAGASQAVVGPYVSVIDSLFVSFTSDVAKAPVVIRRQLTPADTVVTVPVTLPVGAASIVASVVSNNQTGLFSGAGNAVADRNGFSATVTVTPLKPVLVGIPDLATAFSDNTQTQQRYTKFAVHNSGSGTLVWNLQSVDTAFVRCNPPGAIRCFATPSGGQVPPNGNDTLTVSFPIGFFSPHTFAFVIHSAEGNITVRWRYP